MFYMYRQPYKRSSSEEGKPSPKKSYPSSENLLEAGLSKRSVGLDLSLGFKADAWRISPF
jgi:hypothetical protein